MLKFCITLLAVAFVVQAAPQTPVEAVSGHVSDVTPVAIISQYETNGVDGSFNNSFEASNGIKQQNSGFFKKVNVPELRADGTESGQTKEEAVLVQTGSFTYTAPDGQVITLNYVADENGFQPVGDHLPTPPAIPEQILTSLKQQSADASAPTSSNSAISTGDIYSRAGKALEPTSSTTEAVEPVPEEQPAPTSQP